MVRRCGPRLLGSTSTSGRKGVVPERRVPFPFVRAPLVVLATVDSSNLGSRFGKLGLGSVFDDGLVTPVLGGDQVPSKQEVSAKPEESNPPKEEGEEVPLATLEQMRKFSERYAKNSKTYFCSDPGVTAVVIKGLAEHKEAYGAPLCPCRHYDDKEAEVAQGFWNCPCVPMRERNECHCMLFLTEDNPFRAEDAEIGLQEIVDLTDNPGH